MRMNFRITGQKFKNTVTDVLSQYMENRIKNNMIFEIEISLLNLDSFIAQDWNKHKHTEIIISVSLYLKGISHYFTFTIIYRR